MNEVYRAIRQVVRERLGQEWQVGYLSVVEELVGPAAALKISGRMPNKKKVVAVFARERTEQFLILALDESGCYTVRDWMTLLNDKYGHPKIYANQTFIVSINPADPDSLEVIEKAVSGNRTYSLCLQNILNQVTELREAELAKKREKESVHATKVAVDIAKCFTQHGIPHTLCDQLLSITLSDRELYVFVRSSIFERSRRKPVINVSVNLSYVKNGKKLTSKSFYPVKKQGIGEIAQFVRSRIELYGL